MGKTNPPYPPAVWELARDLWAFAAGRDSERTHGMLLTHYGDAAPAARSIRARAIADDWASWADEGPTRLAPALVRAGRELAIARYPHAVATLAIAASQGDTAAAARIVRMVEGMIEGSSHPLAPVMDTPAVTDGGEWTPERLARAEQLIHGDDD